jgi:hypothetical protein
MDSFLINCEKDGYKLQVSSLLLNEGGMGYELLAKRREALPRFNRLWSLTEKGMWLPIHLNGLDLVVKFGEELIAAPSLLYFTTGDPQANAIVFGGTEGNGQPLVKLGPQGWYDARVPSGSLRSSVTIAPLSFFAAPPLPALGPRSRLSPLAERLLAV